MNNKKHKMIMMVMTLVLLFIIVTTVDGLAADSQYERETLKDLQGVELVIEDISPVAEKDGLTRELLQTDVELQLRKSGIKVLTKEECIKTPGMPYLYVAVQLHKKEDSQLLPILSRIYAYAIEVQLVQQVYLTRNPKISKLAATWDVGAVGIAVDVVLETAIRGHLKDYVDKFINAYLAVNPKQ